MVPEHLQAMYERSIQGVPKEYHPRIQQLLRRHDEAFAKNDLDLGRYSGIQHRIRIMEERPVIQRMRRTPLGFEKEEKISMTCWKKASLRLVSPSGPLHQC